MTRYYDAAPADVWAALTEPESIARWLAPARKVDLSVGGAIELGPDGDRPIDARVRAVEAGRLLELDWTAPDEEPSIVRFQLAEDGHGTTLVVDHHRVDARLGMRYRARWERPLARLDALVGQSGAPR